MSITTIFIVLFKAVDAYAKMRINVVKLLGYKKNVEASMKKVLAFEKELAKIFISSTRFRAEVNKLYKKTNFRYLAEEYPEVSL